MEKQFKFQTLNKVESDRQFPTEKSMKGFVQYGIYNDFPEYLIYLFKSINRLLKISKKLLL
jgi:hypothetical protein